LMWLNVNGFRAVLGELAARRMTAGALATSAAAAVLLGIAVAHYSYGRRGSRVGGALFALAVVGSLALPVAARGAAVPVPEAKNWTFIETDVAALAHDRRVVMLLLDGASLEYIRTRVSEGRLPHFSRLLDSGASMYLATVRPTQPGPVWASAGTGMYPAKNGVRSAAQYYARGDNQPLHLLPDHCFSHALVQLGIIRAEAHTSTAFQARPLWSILSQAGVRTGMVRWPVTYPAQPILGFMMSDRFHELLGSMAQFDEGATYPADLLPHARAAFSGEADDGADAQEVAETSASRRDRWYARAMRDLQARVNPQVVALRLQALDTAGHRYYQDSQASTFRDGGEAERRARVQQLERAYSDIDAEVGAAIDSLARDDLLLVISGFGMQRLQSAKELLAHLLGDPNRRGSHERAPDGFLIAYGAAVQPTRLTRGSIVDVTPTVLYFLGLPVGRDMDGFARTDLFTPAFTAERPIAFIATHNR
jgi:predicted AlkP superfamily phosphohydrolase/phosphomutase